MSEAELETFRQWQREQVAHHEAGHAVAGQAMGWQLASCYVVPDKGSYGFCQGKVNWHGDRWLSDVLDKSPGASHRELIVTLAGPIAEALWRDRGEREATDIAHRINDIFEWWGSEVTLEEIAADDPDFGEPDSDLANVYRNLQRLGHAGGMAELHQALRDTLELLTARWEQVEALAAEILASWEPDWVSDGGVGAWVVQRRA